MADIELVIRLSEEDYIKCKNKHLMRLRILDDAVANGKLLPKGHGDLIDRKKLQENIDDKDFISPKDISQIQVLRKWIDNQNPIIEADKS